MSLIGRNYLVLARVAIQLVAHWHFSDTTFVPVDVRLWGAQRKTFARSGYFGLDGREVWLRFARLLVGGLTFQLAADIIETAISTTWESLGRIAVIAVIRTFLNYFLEKDVSRRDARTRPTEVPQ
jgi:uncharacterized membrane protein